MSRNFSIFGLCARFAFFPFVLFDSAFVCVCVLFLVCSSIRVSYTCERCMHEILTRILILKLLVAITAFGRCRRCYCRFSFCRVCVCSYSVLFFDFTLVTLFAGVLAFLSLLIWFDVFVCAILFYEHNIWQFWNSKEFLTTYGAQRAHTHAHVMCTSISNIIWNRNVNKTIEQIFNRFSYALVRI